ncbi:MAG: alpha/beta hydrolase, partial [Actinobacteria bacterium]|nr:alpha/beta hydrolase [Actinomycetota bacterium]
GYRVIAPDQRGYGKSSQPEAITDYDITHLIGDLTGVLDALGEEKAVFVGHDWGSMVVWQMALLAPERMNGVVGMSVPYLHRGPMPPIQMMRNVFGDNFFYILYFQEPGVAEAELGRDAATTMRKLLAGAIVEEGAMPDPAMFANDGRGFAERMAEPEKLPDWLTQEELDHYAAEFSRTGFRGGVNWYRNMDRNWELTEAVGDNKVQMPSLFIGGKLDPVLVMTPPTSGEEWLADHRGTVIIDGAGHWVQQEKPDEVNAALIGFLDDVCRDKG